ncbi:hypothetical protein CTI12_AA582160 [Artemisia annua]|uniref:Craniofacial development protein 2 n=1 Tax=Artemisia annua TaxID=35608 RepID=A0A2U1KNN3_ARTAN|nr:hypothetical protein CTI12_AA582160 [Artemisia annua]
MGVGRLAGSRRIRVGSWNVGPLTGKLFELADVLRRHKETKWKGSSTRVGNGYKHWYSGSRSARNGVGVILAASLKDNVVQVIRKDDRTMKITLVIDEEIVNMISTYAPQVGRTDVEKRIFWDSLNELVRECAADQRLIIGGDLNRHIGATAEGYAGVHGGFCYGVRNDEGCSILEFATSHNLVVVNSFFRKRDGFPWRDMLIPTQIGCLGCSFSETSTRERGYRDAEDFVEESERRCGGVV